MAFAATAPTPPHVPPSLVRDVDAFALPGAEEDVQLAWRKVQQECPDVFWTPRNGGHWIATRAEDIEIIQADHTRFSFRRIIIPDIGRPFPVYPLDLDPPDHAPYRLMISPAFSPAMVARLGERVREVAVEAIESFRLKGECEFVQDFAKVLPIVLFLEMVDLPREDAAILLPLAEKVARSANPDDVTAARLALADYVKVWIDRREREPGGDLLSHIIHYRVGGERMPPEAILGTCSNLLAAGLDTVAAMLGFAARFLADNPGHRRQLADDPSLIPTAVEELIRRHGVANMGRLITHDFTFKGAALKAGEMIQIPNCLYGLDERRVERPLEVDFRRGKVDHAAFGNGPHRCPGAILARRELATFLTEFLGRIPEFSIAEGTKPQMSSGLINGMQRLDLSWDPATTRAL
ncbi:MAG: cytochrome P450 [Novosphingobium sp.]|nr:cytochrome P450 [Novosphingobium sp.]